MDDLEHDNEIIRPWRPNDPPRPEALRSTGNHRTVNALRSWMPGARLRHALGVLGVLTALSGCVHGYGCLLEEPLKHTLTGRIHFRSFPSADGIDSVPILALDRTAYVYAPAHNYQCLAATDVQLVGVSEFPESIIENSHVSVEGSLFEAAAAHEYTRFLVNVTTLLPLPATP